MRPLCNLLVNRNFFSRKVEGLCWLGMLRIVEGAVLLGDGEILDGLALPALVMDAAFQDLLVNLLFHYCDGAGDDEDSELVVDGVRGLTPYPLIREGFGE